jgi:hypothetical protein
MTTAVLENTRKMPPLSTSAEFVAAAGKATVSMGERFHLYDVMAEAGSITTEALASKTDTPMWFVEGWLYAQVSAGYVTYDAANGLYSLSCPL